MKVIPPTLREASTVIVPAPELVKVATSVLVVVPVPPGTPAVQVPAVQLPVVPVQVEEAALPPKLPLRNKPVKTAKRTPFMLARGAENEDWIFFREEDLFIRLSRLGLFRSLSLPITVKQPGPRATGCTC